MEIDINHDESNNMKQSMSDNHEPLVKIGGILRDAREAQNITARSLAQQLRIGEEQLLALESGNITLLPEEVFIKGMISRVAEKLKIETKPLLAILVSETSLEKEIDLPTQTDAVVRQENIPKLFLYIAFIILAILSSWVTISYFHRRLLKVQDNKVLIKNQKLPSKRVSLKTLKVSAKSPSWIAIRNSEGKVLFEGVLNKSKTYTIKKSLLINAVRPDLIVVYQNSNGPATLLSRIKGSDWRRTLNGSVIYSPKKINQALEPSN